MDVELREFLTYALGGSVPGGFLDHLIAHKEHWDEEFWRKLDALAYEFRPDLAVWELTVDSRGYLKEERLPLVSAS